VLNSLPDTWSHPDLIKLSLTDVAEELRHNHDFLWKVYGIDARPYFRPPYGQHNAHVDKISGELGYTADTQWPRGHRDRPPQSHAGHTRLRTARDIIRARKLRTVTLDDVFLKPEAGD
jgi:peptidoglycan/xylan/chitin deacetylase (PgdA/CDA1 family)